MKYRDEIMPPKWAMIEKVLRGDKLQRLSKRNGNKRIRKYYTIIVWTLSVVIKYKMHLENEHLQNLSHKPKKVTKIMFIKTM